MVDGRRSPKTLPTNPSPRDLAVSVRMLADGRSDARVEDVAMALSTTQTVLSDVRFTAVAEDSAIQLSPRNANAAGKAWWVKSKGNGTATIGHPSTAVTMVFDVSWKG